MLNSTTSKFNGGCKTSTMGVVSRADDIFWGFKYTADETLAGTSECSLLAVAAETDGPLLAVASYICGRRDYVRKFVQCSPTPIFPPAARPIMPLNAAIQRIQRLIGSTAFLTDGAGGSFNRACIFPSHIANLHPHEKPRRAVWLGKIRGSMRVTLM